MRYRRGIRLNEQALQQAVRRMTKIALPIAQDVMQHQLEHINELRRAPEFKRDALELEQFTRAEMEMHIVRTKKKATLYELPPEGFSSLLRAAALTGDMPRRLFDEAVERIKTAITVW